MNRQKDSSLISQEWEVDEDMLDAPMMESTDIVEGFSVGGQGVDVIIIVGTAVGRLISGAGGFWLPKTSSEEGGAA